MKFGPVEGTSEEIKNFFQDNGLNAADYFTPPEPPIKTVWFLIPAVFIVCAFAVLTLITPSSKAVATFVFLFGCAAALWLAVNVQIRLKSFCVTGIVLVGCLLIMLVALGVLTPLQMFEEMKALKK